MSQGFLMGLDAGGGGGRCLLVDVESGAFTSAGRSWSHLPAPGTGGLGADLDLEPMWRALGAASREALARAGATPESVLGIATTSMRFALVVLDAEGAPLLAVPNRDGRATAEALELRSRGGEAIQARTGHWPNPVSSLVRLLWLARRDPEAWKQAHAALALSDWLNYRLCGELATDPSQASGSLVYDLETREWAWNLADAPELRPELFPPVRAPGSPLGSLTEAAAEAFGLRPGTPVMLGGGDTQCGLLGAGATRPGDLAAIAGTTTPVQRVIDRPFVDPGLWTELHVVADRWVLESNAGPMGEVLDWLGRVLDPALENPTGRVLAEAARSQPGAMGMLSSLGAEVMDARDLKFPLGNLTLSHLASPDGASARPHLLRSVVEGMAYALRGNLERLRMPGAGEPGELRLGGGMSRSRFWAQLLSDVTGLPVVVSPTPQASGLGAAICAGVGAGVYEGLPAGAEAFGARSRRVEPDAARHETYAARYADWDRLRQARAATDDTARALALPGFLEAAASRSTASSRERFRPRILVTADCDAEGLEALARLGEVEHASFRKVMRLLAGDALVKALAGVQVFVTEVDVLDAGALERLPELRVVVACRSDAVNVDVDACTAFGVPVLNAPGRNAEAVADLTLAFLLMLARKLPQATGFLREPGGEAGDMGRMGRAFGILQGRELWRKALGLVGFGAVGRAVTRRALAFGARVLVHDPFVPEEQVILAGAEPVTLDALLAESDFVSLHCGVTDATRGLIGAAQLEAMKPGACLVNTARAALVDEQALCDALAREHLGGAAVDVFPVEPPGADHPLLAFENVIATPHVGGNTQEVAAHQGEIVARDLARLLQGERPLHLVNPEALEGFDWHQPRREPDAAALEQLGGRPGPAVSDIQREEAPMAKPSKPTAPAPEASTGGQAPAEVREKLERILQGFCERVEQDAGLAAFAPGKDVTLDFSLSDLGLRFHMRFRNDAVAASLGAPDAPAEVQLRMPADVLDGMFTGRVNAMQSAMEGRLSFTGDTVKAMTLQQIQGDLARCYGAAREAVGDPGDLAGLAPAPARGPAPGPAPEDAVREELVRVVQELYEQQLITATGGNVSVRIPGKQEFWITPSQLFKGDLRSEILVRIDAQGQPLDANAPSPSSERLMHCAVYAGRPQVQAVVHAHAPHATILANTDLPFLPVSTEAAFFGNIARVPFIMPGTRELAEAISEAMGKDWAVLMKNHGLLVAGRSLRRAADMVEIIERSAQIILGCYAVGKEPPTLPEEIVETLRRMGDVVA